MGKVKKTIFCQLPHKNSWEIILMNIQFDTPIHFHNIDNAAQNARQAIKRYHTKAKAGKLPYRHFRTRTNSEKHSFTIYRDE